MERGPIARPIPKLLHYVWVGGAPLPSRFRQNIRSWKRFNPGYELRLWDDAALDLDHPFIAEAYRQKAWAKLSDFIRLRAVEQHGGIYLDTDVEAFRSFDALLECQCFFGYQSERAEDEPVCNAVFGAVPGHWFIRRLLDDFPTTTRQDLYEVGTGPELVSAALLRHGFPRWSATRVRVTDIDVFPPPVFYPYHWTEDFTKARIKPETIVVHHWDMSWHRPRSASLMRVLQRLVKAHPRLYRPLRRLYRSLT